MTGKEIKEALTDRSGEEIKYVKGTEIESVEPERFEKLNHYGWYDYTINQDRNASERRQRRVFRLWEKIDSAMRSGKFRSTLEAIEYLKKKEESEKGKAPIYKQLGYETVEDAMEDIFGEAYSRADNFIDTREEQFQKALLPYIEAMLIAGMRAKLLACVWIRLELYGFSVAPYNWDTKESFGREDLNVFPYTSVSEMPKKDREAFEKVSLDVLYEIESHGSFYQLSRTSTYKKWQAEKLNIKSEGGEPEEEGDKRSYFKPYPKDGLSKKELVLLHRDEDNKDASEDEIYSSLFDSWETEPEVYLPILYFRYDEALYYALKYSGDEYKRYIESLNVEEDFDYGTEDESLLYRNIMQKEA